MRKQTDIYFKLILIVLDVLALVASFTAAYILRITLDPRPFYIHIGAIEFITSVLTMLPLWIILFYFFGLYKRDIYSHPYRESGRLLLASIFGVMIMISYGFLTDWQLFPTKLVALYALIISFFILLFLRASLNLIRLRLLKHNIGVRRVALIGNNKLTTSLAELISSDRTTGFKLEAIISRSEFIPKNLKSLSFSTLPTALRQAKIDAVIQTDYDESEKNYEIAEKH